MKVLDATFLIDYLDGVEDAETYYTASGGSDEHWIIPAPAYAEVLVGVGNLPDGEVERAIDALAWADVHDIEEHLSVTAGEIAREIGPEGPFLSGMDGLVAAVGRELNAPVVSADSDLTHETTKTVVEIEEYRDETDG